MANLDPSEMGKKGGKARAESLTKKERSDIARRAAAARWANSAEPARATHNGDIHIGEAILPCAVLADGTRVISQRGMSASLGRNITGSGTHYTNKRANGGVAKLPPFLSAKNIKPFVSLHLAESLSNPIEYIPEHGGRTAFGYDASLLPDICEVWVNAKDAGVLLASQEHIGVAASVMIKALAKTGVIALVDEATGYQRDRARDELAKILEAFVAKEIQKWLKTFDLEFYELMCDLRGEPLERAQKRPPYLGSLTNNLVYERLAPGVLQKLRELNPVCENGRRKTAHFQRLTPDTGYPKLKEHIAGVTTAMKFAKLYGLSWEEFLVTLDKTHPKYKEMPLFDQLEDQE